VLMSAQKVQDYSHIVNNPGFRAIAGCIRQATVIAQYRAAQQNDRRYEIRYGLGQELARKAAYPRDFLAALGEFLHSYNAETARQEELVARELKRPLTAEDRRVRRLRFPSSTQDINDIVALINEFNQDSELICALLLAYGYARDVRDPSTAKMDTTDDATAIDAGDDGPGVEND